MTNVLMYGCNGQMGQVITKLLMNDEEAQIVAGVDIFDDGHNAYPVFKTIAECDIKPDVIIDFCNAKAEDALLDYIEANEVPAVICTTGLSEEQIERINILSKKVAILRSANMSYGVNLLMKLLQQAAPLLSKQGFDIEIVEKHHNLKMDAPSGTALAIADVMNGACDNEFEYIYDRSTKRQRRGKKELGISAVRGGTIVGDHDVIFAGLDEVITISHTAYSKSIFAKGSIAAAKYIKGKEPKLYDMSDVISF